MTQAQALINGIAERFEDEAVKRGFKCAHVEFEDPHGGRSFEAASLRARLSAFDADDREKAAILSVPDRLRLRDDDPLLDLDRVVAAVYNHLLRPVQLGEAAMDTVVDRWFFAGIQSLLPASLLRGQSEEAKAEGRWGS